MRSSIIVAIISFAAGCVFVSALGSRERIAPPPLPTDLLADLEPPKLAMWVEITRDQSVSINIHAFVGCRVDVIRTRNNVPRVVLENVRILAIDGHRDSRWMAALELDTFEQAQRLQGQSPVTLVMRPLQNEG